MNYSFTLLKIIISNSNSYKKEVNRNTIDQNNINLPLFLNTCSNVYNSTCK